MEKLKRWWKRTPATIRRPIVFIVGSIFILGAVLTGWLPGPGGVPLFLIGIAILATEFERAAKFHNFVMRIIHILGKQFKKHRIIGTLLIISGIAVTISLSIAIYKHTN